jgi:Cu-processing system permease protein
MHERAIHVGVIAWAALMETVRRKDLYVVWILAVFGLAGGSILASVGVRGIETFLRDITLSVVNLLSVAICIWLAARQIPEEMERRTLFPMLARPVRRFDVLLGKFLAVWALSSIALIPLALTAYVALAMFKAATGPIFWQYVLLRALSFGPIAAMVILLSLVMSPAATVVLSALLTLFETTFARTIYAAILDADAAVQIPLKAVYFLVPHLDLFDLSQKTAYDAAPIPLWAVLTLIVYALVYVFVFLGLGELRFRRMALQ